VLYALCWVIEEMERRYAIFAEIDGVNNISQFNSRPKQEMAPLAFDEAFPCAENADEESLKSSADSRYEKQLSSEDAEDEEIARELPLKPESKMVFPDHMPFIVVIVDELADLMQTAPADVEGAIARITQKARSAGIHMIVATQIPRSSIVTGIMKANIPSRIAFQVTSELDSHVILDMNGAENLLGKGDMLYRPPGNAKVIRAQGVLVTDEEIHRIVANLAIQAKPVFDPSISAKLLNINNPKVDLTAEEEELVKKSIEIIRHERRATMSMLQRRLNLGYAVVFRIMEILERRSILGPRVGAEDREILIDLDSLDGNL